MDIPNDLRQEPEQMTSAQLAEALRTETAKEEPDDDLVLRLLHTLEERNDVELPAIGEKGQAAWERYRAKRMRKHIRLSLGLRVASLAVLVCLLFTLIPQQATAGSFWKILNRWTDEFFQYVNIGAAPTEPEPYVYHSENPGLEEVYAVVTEELGITDPVVPQWLPEGYELTELTRTNMYASKGIRAGFSKDEAEAVLSFDEMKVDLSSQYEKSDIIPKELEVNGIVHSYMWNKDSWTISWTRQSIKCSIFINCQEEEIQAIIQSIYE